MTVELMQFDSQAQVTYGVVGGVGLLVCSTSELESLAEKWFWTSSEYCLSATMATLLYLYLTLSICLCPHY